MIIMTEKLINTLHKQPIFMSASADLDQPKIRNMTPHTPQLSMTSVCIQIQMENRLFKSCSGSLKGRFNDKTGFSRVMLMLSLNKHNKQQAIQPE